MLSIGAVYLPCMKWLVYFLSLYVLLLSGIPCNADDDCCGSEINTTGHSGKKPTAPCSPFFACCSCHGVVVPDMQLGLPDDAPVPPEHCSFYTEPSLPDFSASIWQPPQLV